MNVSKISFTGNLGKGQLEGKNLKVGDQTYRPYQIVYMDFNNGQEKDIVQITGFERIPPKSCKNNYEAGNIVMSYDKGKKHYKKTIASTPFAYNIYNVRELEQKADKAKAQYKEFKSAIDTLTIGK